MTNKKDINFEKAFTRLEEILEAMNKGTIGLDESLKLYEEADGLIKICGSRLREAERKVQILIKGRSGEVTTNEDGEPELENFDDPQS